MKEDEAKMEKLKKRSTTLEEVNNNLKLLNEMLARYSPESSAVSEMQTMKVCIAKIFLVLSRCVVVRAVSCVFKRPCVVVNFIPNG